MVGIDREVIQCMAWSLAAILAVVMLTGERLLTPRVPLILASAAGLGLATMSGGALWAMGIWQVNHWMSAIGLSSRGLGKVYGRSPGWYSAALVVAGVGLFCLLFVHGSLVYVTPVAIGLRLGLGMAHFFYDGEIYKFRDPLVGATIGKALFT